MKRVFRIGSLAGIPIGIHWTFLLILVWVGASSLSNGGNSEDLVFNLVLVLAVFFCIILHELGHALTARRFGIKTRDILITPFGGLARMERLPEKPAQEILVALAGPFINLVIGFGLMVSLLLSGVSFSQLIPSEGELITEKFYLITLFRINIFLILFNLIPAFPLDGGRVFRALLQFRMSRLRATRVAAIAGQVFAVGFVVAGFFFNVFLVLIGGFVLLGARNELRMVKARSVLEQHRVSEAMQTDFELLPVATLLSEVKLGGRNRVGSGILVSDGVRVVGILTRPAMALAEKRQDHLARVGDIMQRKFPRIDINDSLLRVYSQMHKHRIGFLPVYQDGHLAGVIQIEVIGKFLSDRVRSFARRF